jgi:succinyl-diaminopimelate desuccinylase
MLDIFKTLISLPTVSEAYSVNDQALTFIEDFLARHGMHITRFAFGDHPSLIATTRNTKTPEIFLVAHVDVAPARPELFNLREHDGKFYGRGVFDMKFAIPAYLHIIEDVADDLTKYNIGIMITSDEELGGTQGVSRLVELGYIPRKVCIVPDGGDNWAIETFSKGVWHAKLSAKGKSAHGSRPWEGDSALEKVITALADIRQRFATQGHNTSTMSIGTLHAGHVTNQIPDTASADIDVRTMTKEEHELLKREVTGICTRHTVTCDIVAEGLPYTNMLDNPYVALFANCIEERIGHPAGHTMSFASSDARHFAALGVPCVIVRPPGGGHHGSQEWIEAQGFYDFYTIVHNYINKLTGIDDEMIAARKESLTTTQ